MIIPRALFQLLNENSDAVLSPSVGDGSQMSVTLSTGLFVDMMMADNRMAKKCLWLCIRLYYGYQKYLHLLFLRTSTPFSKLGILVPERSLQVSLALTLSKMQTHRPMSQAVCQTVEMTTQNPVCSRSRRTIVSVLANTPYYSPVPNFDTKCRRAYIFETRGLGIMNIKYNYNQALSSGFYDPHPVERRLMIFLVPTNFTASAE
jgi:hypothetical protein